MDIYDKKSMWKIYLAIAGLLIVLISMTYTNYLATHLAEEERKKVDIWYSAYESLGATDPTENMQDFTLHLKIMENNNTIPAIIVNDRGKIDYAINFGMHDNDDEFLKKELEEIKLSGSSPLKVQNLLIYYKPSTLLSMLNYFPIIQFILIAAFIAIGYIGFSSARRAEQNQVWVGMAKETAHQLGTPISAILAWIEHLKANENNDENTIEIINELANDVDRLTLVADRFSKIGSAPTLEKINVYEELNKCKNYMEKRAPRKVQFNFPPVDEAPLFININCHLFDWVVENLLRNALDAMDGKGSISAEVLEEKGFITINLTDTGKGIQNSKFKTVFQPGFTTKKRGWGLGLSLAKRIIESYHSGKIFVKSSEINRGTTFSIKLPQG